MRGRGGIHADNGDRGASLELAERAREDAHTPRGEVHAQDSGQSSPALATSPSDSESPVEKPLRPNKWWRLCYRCKELLPVDEFSPDPTKGSGRMSICRPCDRERARVYYLANRERRLAGMKARAVRKREGR